MSDEEKYGVKAIIALQGLAGIEESEDQALAGWRAMSDYEKAATRHAYTIFFPEEATA